MLPTILRDKTTWEKKGEQKHTQKAIRDVELLKHDERKLYIIPEELVQYVAELDLYNKKYVCTETENVMESALYSLYSLVVSYNKTHSLAKPRSFVLLYCTIRE